MCDDCSPESPARGPSSGGGNATAMKASLPFYLTRIGGALGALAILCAGCQKNPSAEDAPSVKVHKVEVLQVDEEIAASGFVEAVDRAPMGFMIAGRVAAVCVEDGDTVKAGQVLARLEDGDLRNEVSIADGHLGEILDRHTRLTQLHALGSLTTTDFEKSKAALTEAAAAADLAHRRLGYSEIYAPFAGRILRSGVARGSVVAPGMTVCTVLGSSPVWASLSVPEVDIARVRVGQRARVALAATENSETTAPVEEILPQADAITRSFTVKVRLPNADGAFRPGNVLTASVMTGLRRGAVALPPQLVQHFADGSLYVWIVDARQRTVTRRIVEVGRMHGTRVEVVAGLAGGELVAYEGGASLFDGMRVSPVGP